nr:nucleoside 2-deoxyribosyltransferase [Planctomycetota bacterium]
KTQLRVVETVLHSACVGAVRMPAELGPTGGTIVSPRFLREYIFPWHKRIGEIVHAKGLLYMYHSDGRLYQVIDDLIACGFQALHPCEPASMDIDQLKRTYAGRLCLNGNINLDSTMTLGSPEDVEQEVKLRIRTLGPGGGYCCGTSNSVPEYVPFENYTAMIRTIQQHGTYPIHGA